VIKIDTCARRRFSPAAASTMPDTLIGQLRSLHPDEVAEALVYKPETTYCSVFM
jgi:hypothetical protein